MDTTPEFIKMCEKAEEIQALRFPDFYAGDWYISHNGYPMVIGSALPMDMDLHRRGEIWLPRQDQLQEMVEDTLLKNLVGLDYRGWGKRHIDLYWVFRYWFEKKAGEKYIRTFNSMEQLWLAFIMKERYQKEWRNDKWNLIRKIG